MKNYKLTYEENGVKKYLNIKAKDKFNAQNKALKMQINITNIQEIENITYKFNKINEEKFILFFKDLSLLCEVGLSVFQALNELLKSYDKKMQENIKILIANLNNGLSLNLAFSSFNLDKSELNLIQMAENTGKLSEVFKQIANLKEKNLKNKRFLKKALQYPIFILLSVIFAFIFLMLFVVGEFKMIFDEFGASLPFITKIMIFIYDFLNNYLVFMFLIFSVFSFMLIFFYKKSYYFSFMIDMFLIKIPFINKIIIYNQNYHFFMVFSLLLKSGISTMQALNLATLGIKNKFLFKKYEQILSFLKQGLEFNKAFKRVNIFDNAIISMLFVASKSAKLEQISEQIAKYYENKQEQFIDRFLTLLEPFLTLIVAILVLFLTLGIFLPMWELNSIKSF